MFGKKKKLTVDDFDQDLIPLEKCYREMQEVNRVKLLNSIEKTQLARMAGPKSPLELVKIVQAKIQNLFEFPLSNYGKGRVAFVRDDNLNASTFFCYPEKGRELDSLYFRALISLRINDLFNCERVISEMGELDHPRFYYLKGKYLFKDGDYIGASVMFEDSLPEVKESNTELGYLALIRGDNELAKKHFWEGIRNEVVDCFIGMGDLCELEYQYDLAEEYYLAAIERGSKEAWSKRGELKKKQKILRKKREFRF